MRLDAALIISDLVSSDQGRRERARQIIGNLECNTPVDVSVFVAALEEPNHEVVFWSIIALQHLGERGSEAIPMLLRLIRHDQLFLRQCAVNALGRVGPADKRAKEGVLSCLADPSPFMRREALQACIQLRALSTDDLAAIAGMAADSSEEVARWSEIALRNLRIRAQETGPDA